MNPLRPWPYPFEALHPTCMTVSPLAARQALTAVFHELLYLFLLLCMYAGQQLSLSCSPFLPAPACPVCQPSLHLLHLPVLPGPLLPFLFNVPPSCLLQSKPFCLLTMWSDSASKSFGLTDAEASSASSNSISTCYTAVGAGTTGTHPPPSTASLVALTADRARGTSKPL